MNQRLTANAAAKIIVILRYSDYLLYKLDILVFLYWLKSEPRWSGDLRCKRKRSSVFDFFNAKRLNVRFTSWFPKGVEKCPLGAARVVHSLRIADPLGAGRIGQRKIEEERNPVRAGHLSGRVGHISCRLPHKLFPPRGVALSG
jgi:hypothetical protein